MRGLYKLNVSCLQMASAIIDGSLKKRGRGEYKQYKRLYLSQNS